MKALRDSNIHLPKFVRYVIICSFAMNVYRRIYRVNSEDGCFLEEVPRILARFFAAFNMDSEEEELPVQDKEQVL